MMYLTSLYLILNAVYWFIKYNQMKKDFQFLLEMHHDLLDIYTESVIDDPNSNN